MAVGGRWRSLEVVGGRSEVVGGRWRSLEVVREVVGGRWRSLGGLWGLHLIFGSKTQEFKDFTENIQNK